LPESDYELLRSILREAEREVTAWNGKLNFVYLPSFERYKSPAKAPEFKDDVVSLATDLGIPVIDVDLAFRELPDPLDLFPFPQRGHYNDAGYRIVAEAIARQLDVG
jgi:hypothetical protein